VSPQVELSGNFPAAPVSGPDAGDGFRIEIKDMEERTAAHNRAIDEFVRRRRPEQWFCLNSREQLLLWLVRGVVHGPDAVAKGCEAGNRFPPGPQGVIAF
jgi:hypothetical protein